MRFDGAEGALIGDPGRGLAAMFLMMNSARLHVGMQGLGHLEAATQNAGRYAFERLQMRSPERPDAAAPASADPIAWHPAIRRTLLALRAKTLGARVLACRTALLLDEAEHHPDPVRAQAAADRVALLTPIVKAFLTDLGHRGADDALQVWGGYGFVTDFGIEQAVRDSRIAMIYEGTNEIQAIDLLQRKVLEDGGQRLAGLIADLVAEADACAAVPALHPFADALRAQACSWHDATSALVAGRGSHPGWAGRVADDYLHGAGHALLAWGWAAVARTLLCGAGASPAAGTDPNRAAWLADARHGVDWVLPQAQVHWARVALRDAALDWVPAP
jgi:hypothetical protein